MKSREWWIEFIGDPKDDSLSCYRYVTGEKFKAIDHGHEMIHVREVDPAYDAAVQKLVEALRCRYEPNGDLLASKALEAWERVNEGK